MSKWEKVYLEHVCEILDSMRVPVTASDRKSGIYPYYGANGVQDYVSDYIFDDELVLLAEDGGNFGSKTRPIAYRVSGKCWVNNHAHVLKAKPMLNIDYLCYSLMFYDVSKIISGTTRAKLNQAAMRKITIPFPPIDIQQNIAATLDKASEIISMRKKQLEELDNLIKSIFYDMFGDPVTNEKGWEINQLNKLVSKLGDGLHGTPAYSANGDYYFINGNNLNNGFISINGATKRVLVEEYEKYKKALNLNTMLVSINGTLGNVAFYRNEKIILGKSVCYFNVLDCVNKKYLYYILKSEYFLKYSLDSATGSTIKNVSLKAMRDFPIPVPPLSLQNQFAAIVEKIEEQKALVQKALDESQYLFDSLMDKYFGD